MSLSKEKYYTTEDYGNLPDGRRAELIGGNLYDMALLSLAHQRISFAGIVSPSSRKMGYITKAGLYLEAGVREYWIIDPEKKCTTVYYFEEDAAPMIVPFSAGLSVRIYGDLEICMDTIL